MGRTRRGRRHDREVCSGRKRTTTSKSSGRGPEPALTHAGAHDSAPSFPAFLIPLRHSRHFQSPSVIPDIFNRESIPMQGHPNEGTEEKDTGFPLTTGGNDRGDRRAGQKGASGQDRRRAVGRTEGGRWAGQEGAAGMTGKCAPAGNEPQRQSPPAGDRIPP